MRRVAFLAAVAASLVFAVPASAAPQELTYRYGPINLGPYQVNQNTVFNGVPKPNVDGFITHMEADVVDASGNKVPPTVVMLHHIVFLNLGEPGKFDHHDWTCSIFTALDGKTKLPALADRFYASGEERNVLQLPPGYGYPVKGTDSWVLLWMLMNHHPISEKVYIQYKVTYDTAPLSPAYMVWLDVRNCLSDPIFDVPGGGLPGSTFSQSTTWTAPMSGRLVAGGGHLHGGGKSISLSEPDCGNRELFTSRPLYGMPDAPVYRARPILHEPGPLNMSGFLASPGLPVAKGQRLQLTATYDNRYLHTRVMGIMGVYFTPDATVAGCEPLPPLQTYAATGPGRSDPPRFPVPLLRRPAGKVYKLRRKSASLEVGDNYFGKERIRLRRGATLHWRFDSSQVHDVTVATGPVGFSSSYLSGGRSFKYKFKKPGTYKLYCTLHPLQMTQVVKVTRR